MYEALDPRRYSSHKALTSESSVLKNKSSHTSETSEKQLRGIDTQERKRLEDKRSLANHNTESIDYSLPGRSECCLVDKAFK